MLYKLARAMLYPIIYLLFWPKIEGIENTPESGKVIIYSNHSSVFDPMVLGTLIPRRIHFMAKEELFKNSFFGAVLRRVGAFPVKRGKGDISAIKNSLRILKEDKALGMFPEGTRNKSGEIQNFARGIASIAVRAKSSVLPVAIVGGYRPFRRIKVLIGDPICYEEYHNKRISSKELDKISEDMEYALRSLMY
ncbi:MAG: 1-acyl-sn-glycerol-3-phosphate acyltransferase [Clostridiales bacterium]|nr:1-acyl-sn-glycerol-3-phosphate acyltransferase [Clostridiales bacterium]